MDSEGSIHEYARDMMVGKRIVDVESADSDYPFYKLNVLVFEDGTRISYIPERDGTTTLMVNPPYPYPVRVETAW